MGRLVRTLVTALVAAGLAIGTVALCSLLWPPLRETWVLILVGALAALHGTIAGILGSYDLRKAVDWGLLVVDHTWALPSTLLGTVVGNAVYPFFGTPSGALSAGRQWIAYRPRGSSGFGVDVLQTIGTVNIGGAGKHERVHLVQARILGPAFLPVVGISYVASTLVQLVFSGTVGAVLSVTKVREKAYFRPPARSAVEGFWGWVYFVTPMELWAYATEP